MNNRIKDLTGQVFGRLTALRCVGSKNYKALWECVCLCGSIAIVDIYNLRGGITKSCGYLSRDTARVQMAGRRGKNNLGFKHGHNSPITGTSPTYRSWTHVIERCTKPNHQAWSHYGGANPPVKVCDRWRNSFVAFLEDLGERPENTTLGRYGDIGNYEPGNCSWQTWKEQRAEQKIKRQLKLAVAA